MGKELSGPFGAEINAKHAEWQEWKAQYDDLDGKIAQAASNYDLETLTSLMTERLALPLILKALERDHAALREKRAESFQAQTRAREVARSAELDKKPKVETIVDPNTGSKTIITRGKW